MPILSLSACTIGFCIQLQFRMKKKSYPEDRQEQSMQLGKEGTLNISHQMPLRRQPSPQLHSYHQIPHPANHTRPGHLPLPSQNSAVRFRQGRIHQHAQFLTQQSIPVLRQRLKSIQEYYQMMAAEQRNRNAQRSEVIIELIEQMQTAHLKKMEGIRKMIQQSEEQKRDMGFVDDKMNEIKGNIEELIEDSNTLKGKNRELERKIERKRKEVREKENQLEQLSKELLEARGELEGFEVNNLKNNKINRQIMEIFNSASRLTSDE